MYSIKQQRGATLLLLTVLIIGSLLFVSLTVSEVLRIGLKLSRGQYNSTKAYFAAEAGAERMIYEIRKNSPPPSDDCETGAGIEAFFCFDGGGVTQECAVDCTTHSLTDIRILANRAEYRVSYQENGATSTLTSYGGFDDLNRLVELKY